MELGYHVTLVRDGTAARSHKAMHGALDINGPTYAHAILSTAELVSALKAYPTPDLGDRRSRPIEDAEPLTSPVRL
jgi:hypothetical protein